MVSSKFILEAFQNERTQQKPEANAGAHLELRDPDPLVAPVVSLVTNPVRHV